MRRLICSLCLLLGMPFSLAEGAVPPDHLVDQATQELLAVVEDARGYYDSDPKRYFDTIEQVIAPLVDFYSFSRGVMGEWGSRSYYQSLKSTEKKQEFEDQVKRFTSVFRRSLVETYGKGLMAFGGERIEVRPVSPEDLENGNTYVVQLIHVEDGPPHKIRYRMKRDGDGHWRIRNVILDEINLGVVYRNQFAASVTKYEGNVGRVIDNWRLVDSGEE